MRTAAIITVHNEGHTGYRQRTENGPLEYEDALSEKHAGNEVRATIESIRSNTAGPLDILVVDDGSTDGCCDGLEAEGVRVIRHKERIGIAFSRREAAEAVGSDVDVIGFYDAHMRISPGCLDACAEIARKYGAMVWPDIRGLRDRLIRGGKAVWTGHGASATTHETQPLGNKYERGRRWFGSHWIHRAPRDKLSRVGALKVPGYVMTRMVYEQIKFSPWMRAWGCGEAALWVKCFFLDIDILHVCEWNGQATLARHLFRSHGPKPYALRLSDNYRNQAIVARVAFDDLTWRVWWCPHVFDKKWLDDEARKVLNSPELIEEHLEFQTRKKRPDSEFWRGLCLEEVPDARIA